MVSLPGVKISFEGIDGSGKTTQVRLLEKELRARGYCVHIAVDNSDASSEDLSGQILSLLEQKQDRFFRIGYPATEALLLAARASYLNEVEILPKLRAGCVVLCDRDIDTFVSYGVSSLMEKYSGLETKEVVGWLLNLVSIGRKTPDLTILFKPDLEVFLPRATKATTPQGTVEEFAYDEVAFLEQTAQVYCSLGERFRDRIRIVEVSNRSPEDVLSELLVIIQEFLRSNNVPRDD